MNTKSVLSAHIQKLGLNKKSSLLDRHKHKRFCPRLRYFSDTTSSDFYSKLSLVNCTVN